MRRPTRKEKQPLAVCALKQRKAKAEGRKVSCRVPATKAKPKGRTVPTVKKPSVLPQSTPVTPAITFPVPAAVAATPPAVRAPPPAPPAAPAPTPPAAPTPVLEQWFDVDARDVLPSSGGFAPVALLR